VCVCVCVCLCVCVCVKQVGEEAGSKDTYTKGPMRLEPAWAKKAQVCFFKFFFRNRKKILFRNRKARKKKKVIEQNFFLGPGRLPVFSIYMNPLCKSIMRVVHRLGKDFCFDTRGPRFLLLYSCKNIMRVVHRLGKDFCFLPLFFFFYVLVPVDAAFLLRVDARSYTHTHTHTNTHTHTHTHTHAHACMHACRGREAG